MSVPKGHRTTSPVKYFDNAYKIVDTITKYLISDFGTKRTYNNLYVFSHKAKMSDEDKEVFEELVNKYHLDIETAYSYWLIEHYRDTMLSIMTEMIKNISHAHTMYPNSVYEFSIRRQYQTDAISNCYDLKHTLQLAIKIFPANLEKYVPYIRNIDEEIKLLKDWRKESNKFKKTCYDNDEKCRRESMKRVVERSSKVNDNNFVFNMIASSIIDISPNQLIKNLQEATFYIDKDNRYCSDKFVPGIVFVDNNGKIISDGINN